MRALGNSVAVGGPHGFDELSGEIAGTRRSMIRRRWSGCTWLRRCSGCRSSSVGRWLRRSLSHAEDAKDHNLPLMIWYGIEPLVAGGSGPGDRVGFGQQDSAVDEFHPAASCVRGQNA